MYIYVYEVRHWYSTRTYVRIGTVTLFIPCAGLFFEEPKKQDHITARKFLVEVCISVCPELIHSVNIWLKTTTTQMTTTEKKND
jgi:hypothetical protein